MAGCKPGRDFRTSQHSEQVQVLQPGSYQNDIIIRGSCKDIDINILLDTGASVSLVSTRLITQLDMMDNIRPTKILIKAWVKI